MKFLSYRNLTLFIVILLFAFWIWAFSPWVTRGHPDQLETETYPLSAAEFCMTIFPNGEWEKGKNEILATETPEARAELVRESNTLLEELIAGLKKLSTEHDLPEDDRVLITAWLVDWDSYLEDRVSWAEVLESGEDRPLQITARSGGRTTDRINNFSSINKMRACNVPNFI